MHVIGVKYCGGCNPHIDRAGLVKEIENLLLPGCRLTTDRPPGGWEIAIFVCGCPIACADRPATRNMSRHWIRVRGATVDLELVPEDKMAVAIARKIKTLKGKQDAHVVFEDPFVINRRG